MSQAKTVKAEKRPCSYRHCQAVLLIDTYQGLACKDNYCKGGQCREQERKCRHYDAIAKLRTQP